MKRSLLTISLCLIVSIAFAQLKNINGIWVTPSKIQKINGLFIETYPASWVYDSIYPRNTNGIYLNISPINFLVAGFQLIYLIHPSLNDVIKINSALLIEKDLKYKKINGIYVGFSDLDITKLNGIALNIGSRNNGFTNGICFSLLANYHMRLNGLGIALYGNHDIECNGVQIGIFNSCKNLMGFQFGIWNKNQKRSLPFINWCFEKSKK
jgi:hypothetical protein